MQVLCDRFRGNHCRRGGLGRSAPLIEVLLTAVLTIAVVGVCVADSVRISGNTAYFDTAKFSATIANGKLTTLVNKETGTSYITPDSGTYTQSCVLYNPGAVAWDPTEDLATYPTGTIVNLNTAASLTRLSNYAVEWRYNLASNTTVWVNAQLDTVTKDIVIQMRTSGSTRSDLQRLRWGIDGIVTSLDVILPSSGGARISGVKNPTLFTREYFMWPYRLGAQFAVVQGNNEGFWIRSDDTACVWKGVDVDKRATRTSMTFDSEVNAPFTGHTSFTGVNWRISTFKGNWTLPVHQYREWMAKNYEFRTDNPGWVNDVKLSLYNIDIGAPDSLFNDLAGLVSPSSVLVGTTSWLNHPWDNLHYPDYTPTTAGDQWLKRRKDGGYREMPWVNILLCCTTSPFYSLSYHELDPFTGYLHPYPQVGTEALMNPASDTWREDLVAQIVNNGTSGVEQLATSYPPSAISVDSSFGHYQDAHGIIDGKNPLQGMIQLHKDMATALPGIPLAGEDLSELNCRYESFAFIHGYRSCNDPDNNNEWTLPPANDSMLCPVYTVLFSPFTKLFGFWGTHGDNAISVHNIQAYQLYRFLPSISPCYSLTTTGCQNLTFPQVWGEIPPVLTNAGQTSSNGATTFGATYQDSNNYGPGTSNDAYVRVVVDGIPYDMTGPASPNYPAGAVFGVTINGLATGLGYHFEAFDGWLFARYPTTGEMTLSVPQPSCPPVTTDLAAWYEGSQVTTLTDGSTVAQWRECSGSGIGDLTARNNEPSQPQITFKSSVPALGGRPAVHLVGGFNTSSAGAENQIYLRADANAALQSSQYTIFAVVANATFTSGALVNVLDNSTGTNDVDNSVNQVAMIGLSGVNAFHHSSLNNYTQATDASLGTAGIIEGLFGNTPTDTQCAANGTLCTTLNTGGSPANFTNISRGIKVGHFDYWTASWTYPTADIGEILIYKRKLTYAERNLVGNYLARKYGLSTSYNCPPVTATGLAAWYTADSMNLADAATVSQWQESSGSGIGALTARNNGSSQITYKASVPALGGKPAVHLAGGFSPTLAGSANHTYLRADANPALQSSEYTIFAATANATLTNGALVNVLDNSQGTLGFPDVDDSINESAMIGYGAVDAFHSSSMNNFAQAMGGALGTGGIIEALFGTAPTDTRCITNGTIGAAPTLSGTPTNYANISRGIKIGHFDFWHTAWTYPTADVSEVLVYKQKLTDTQRNLVGSYLANKYGLSTSYNAPPVSSGLAAWYAADTMGLADGARITQWQECSGSGMGALTARNNGATPAQITYKASVPALDGKPAVHLEGGFSPSYAGSANHTYLRADANAALQGSEYTIFAVVANATMTGGAIVNVLDNTHGTFGFTDVDDNIDESAMIGYHAVDSYHCSSMGNYAQALGGSLGTAGILEGLFGAAPEDTDSFANGYSNGSATMGGSPPDFANISRGIKVGHFDFWHNTWTYPTVDIAEILIYKRKLTYAERGLVGHYLADKYGLTVNYNGPPVASGLGAWYAADAMNLADGARVSQWQECSGSGTGALTARNNNANPAQITYNASVSALGGKPAVHLAGGFSPALAGSANHTYLRADAGSALQGTGYTVFAVVANATLAGGAIVNVLDNTQGTMGFTDVDDTCTQAAMIGCYGVGAYHHTSLGNYAFGPGGTLGTAGIIEGLFGTTPTDTRCVTNGYLGGAPSTDGSPVDFTNIPRGIKVGHFDFWYNTWTYPTADIAEILIYKRKLTDTERNLVGTYLADKYGLSTGY
ncbi:MAG: DUF6259 domain-containing protein [Armatimonadota bacterium]